MSGRDCAAPVTSSHRNDPEGRALWRTLPGQRLMRLMLEGRARDEAGEKFRWLLDRLRADVGIREPLEPRQLSLFYAEPPLSTSHGRAPSNVQSWALTGSPP